MLLQHYASGCFSVRIKTGFPMLAKNQKWCVQNIFSARTGPVHRIRNSWSDVFSNCEMYIYSRALVPNAFLFVFRCPISTKLQQNAFLFIDVKHTTQPTGESTNAHIFIHITYMQKKKYHFELTDVCRLVSCVCYNPTAAVRRWFSKIPKKRSENQQITDI